MMEISQASGRSVGCDWLHGSKAVYRFKIGQVCTLRVYLPGPEKQPYNRENVSSNCGTAALASSIQSSSLGETTSTFTAKCLFFHANSALK